MKPRNVIRTHRPRLGLVLGEFIMDQNCIHEDVDGGVPLKMWTRGVPVEDEAKRQLTNAARLPIVFKHIAAMADVHFGIGAVLEAQRDLVDVVHTLKQVVYVKG